LPGDPLPCRVYVLDESTETRGAAADGTHWFAKAGGGVPGGWPRPVLSKASWCFRRWSLKLHDARPGDTTVARLNRLSNMLVG
jgi:hypothetical protein